MILVDECVYRGVVRALRAVGFAVVAVAEVARRSPDEAVLELARRQGAILLTADRDFGDLVIRDGLEVSGVILLRLGNLPVEAHAGVLLQHLGTDLAPFVGQFTVVSPHRMRKRPLLRGVPVNYEQEESS